MDSMEVDNLVKKLSAGFEALQDEYQKLFGQHQALERKLATARDQYNEIAKLYGADRTSTPPLSLSSSPALAREDAARLSGAAAILEARPDSESKAAADKIRAATAAANALGLRIEDGVKIWSGPAADKLEGSTCLMPSISESPLEQDFTVEGKPSKLGCPFSSMAHKKLSSHAASVLSRYNHSNSVGGHGSVGAASTPLSTASRINGRESLSRRQSRRASFVDPIKAEICGLSDHHSARPDSPVAGRNSSPEKTRSERPDNGEAGVCPIRFLDQHSPEEVATYFEKHKHELPRSHEICVMRYQSNEEQIRELDAKYGNLVSMIKGLGETHKDMLPIEPDEAADEDAEEALDDAKVRKWASSVSAQAPERDVEEDPEERQPHFERPLRDIRVGESPSRPWGIQVPATYLERVASETSSKPVHLARAASPDIPPIQQTEGPQETKRPPGKCPFGHGAVKDGMPPPLKPIVIESTSPNPRELPASGSAPKADVTPDTTQPSPDKASPPMVFTGPVFIGYSPEDAARILSGLNVGQQKK